MPDDLYTQWLGVPAGPRPPDYYTLLNLPRFCSESQQIDAAARRQLAQLDQSALHPDRAKRDACTRMMNEVARARMVLLDEPRRMAYDQQLVSQISQQGGAAQDDSHQTLEMPTLEELWSPVEQSATEAPQPRAAEADDEHDPIDDVLAELRGRPLLADSVPELVHPSRGGPSATFFVSMGVLALLVLAGVLFVVSNVFRGPAPQDVAPVTQAQPTPTPTVISSGTFFDDFTRSELGLDYRMINTPASALRLEAGRLTLLGVNEQPVRLDLVPRQQRNFQEASTRLTLEPGSQVSFGIIDAARMTLTRRGDVVEIQVTPGYAGTRPESNREWPRINLAERSDPALEVRLLRRRETVTWAVDGEIVATSPDFITHGTRGISVQASGGIGPRMSLDNLRVLFDN